MPLFANRSQVLLIAANAVLAGALFVGATGCADALVYAQESRKQGMELYNEGNYIDASASFANATRQDPRDYKSYYYMGASYQAMRSYQQAISAYRSCLDEMELTLDGQRDIPFRYRAIDSLATAISKSSSHGVETVALENKTRGHASVEDQWLLAKIYRYTGDADAAIEAYNKAVLLDPENFTVAKEAGLYEQGLGVNDRAIFALKKAYAANPDDQQVNDALHRLGVVATNQRSSQDLSAPPVPGNTPGAWGSSAQVPRD